ncbi:hypothetical protein BH23CHL8_BH23CHL8_31480 [soil metagenome]
MTDPYRILFVQPDAPAGVIEAAYRALARLYHPDTGQGDTARMAAINVAVERLRHRRPPPPALSVTMPFGKYKGRPLASVPVDYLSWLLSREGLRSGLRADIETVAWWRGAA